MSQLGMLAARGSYAEAFSTVLKNLGFVQKGEGSNSGQGQQQAV